MAFTSGPFAATVTSSLTINPPQPGGTYYSQVVVSNVTPFLATVVIQSAQSFLLPYTSDVFDVTTSGTSVSVAMSQAPGGPSVSTAGASSFVTAEWYLPTDTFPGSAYPISLTSQAVAAAIAGTVTAQYQDTLLAQPAGATLTITTGAAGIPELPTNTQTIEILFPSGGSTTTCNVVGTFTGTPYGGVSEVGLGTRFRFRVSYAADNNVQITVTNPGGSWVVVASPAVLQVDSVLYGVSGGTNVNPPDIVQVGAAGVTIAMTSLGSALPSAAQVVQAGSDGTDTHILSTDTTGHLVLGQPNAALPVEMQGTIPGLKVAAWASNLAAAATTTIVAASAGKTITIYGIDADICAGAVTVGLYIGSIQGITSGTVVAQARTRILTAIGAAGPVKLGVGWLPVGFALSSGEGLEFIAAAANSANIDSAGVVYYTQA